MQRRRRNLHHLTLRAHFVAQMESRLSLVESAPFEKQPTADPHFGSDFRLDVLDAIKQFGNVSVPGVYELVVHELGLVDVQGS